MRLLGTIISETRKSKGLTQEQLAELSKMNLRTIQRLENNENIPRGKTLHLICDVLELKAESLINVQEYTKTNTLNKSIINFIFLLIFNLLLMSCIGFLTLDTEANMNSRVGAILLSVFIPLFIVLKTQNMGSVKRLLKFGLGLVIYLLAAIILASFPYSLISGLIPCVVFFLGILYYGDKLLKGLI